MATIRDADRIVADANIVEQGSQSRWRLSAGACMTRSIWCRRSDWTAALFPRHMVSSKNRASHR